MGRALEEHRKPGDTGGLPGRTLWEHQEARGLPRESLEKGEEAQRKRRPSLQRFSWAISVQGRFCQGNLGFQRKKAVGGERLGKSLQREKPTQQKQGGDENTAVDRQYQLSLLIKRAGRLEEISRKLVWRAGGTIQPPREVDTAPSGPWVPQLTSAIQKGNPLSRGSWNWEKWCDPLRGLPDSSGQCWLELHAAPSPPHGHQAPATHGLSPGLQL